MIIREFYETRYDGKNLYRTYSDENKYIQKVGTEEIYEDAVDLEENNVEYIELDKTIEIL